MTDIEDLQTVLRASCDVTSAGGGIVTGTVVAGASALSCGCRGGPSGENPQAAERGDQAQPRACGGCSRARPAECLSPITTSVFELFKVGIGPSSSHTVGPLVACRRFVRSLAVEGKLRRVSRVQVQLCGSLGLTGLGHYTNKAVALGLTGVAPADVDPDDVEPLLAQVAATGKLTIGFPGEPPECKGSYHEIGFDEVRDVTLHAEELPLHPNGMICRALDDQDDLLMETTYYSIGGGFVSTDREMAKPHFRPGSCGLPFEFFSMSDLVAMCRREGLSIAELMRKNEEAGRPAEEVDAALAEIWRVMEACVDRGLDRGKAGLPLPGPLGIVRRAPDLHSCAKADEAGGGALAGMMDELRWLDCYALAVMEENACMGQVVTAPTNGASGVVPATLTFYMRHLRHKQPESKQQSPGVFLLTAAAVGILAKERACISGAAGGCQAEIGTASAMAAAGLCAVLGGTPEQVDEAAEIAMEHSLGMTCDPVLGLVQVPCIERNTMGASKALNAVCLVLKSRATQRRSMLSYDDVLRVMKATGQDMSARYRETAQGGLAADYEAMLEADAERWESVQRVMGTKRVQLALPRAEARGLAYEDPEFVPRSVTYPDLCKC